MLANRLEKPLSYYELLEIAPDASDEEVKRAYRLQALKYHPDRPGLEDRKSAERRFRQINEAYAHLKTSERRAHYNTVLFAENDNNGKVFSFWAQIAGLFTSQKNTNRT